MADDFYTVASGARVDAGRLRPGIVPAWRAGLTPNTWAALGSNTQLSLLQTALGTNQGVVDGWGGWARNGRKLYLTGGGHSDGSENGILQVDLSQDSPVWSRIGAITAPADRVEYTKSAYPGATGNYYAKWNDDQRPTAAHIYHGFQYLPVVNRLFRGHYFNNDGVTRSTPQAFAPNNENWVAGFNLATGEWDAPATWALCPDFNYAVSDSSGGFARNPTCTDGAYIYTIGGSSDGSGIRVRKFDPVANAWTAASVTTVGPTAYNGYCYDSLRNRLVEVTENVAQCNYWNLSTGVKTVNTRTGAAAAMGGAWDSSYMGVCYDSTRDCYYAYAGQSGTGKSLYRINPATFDTTVMSVSGTPATVSGAGLNSRMAYLTDLDCIVMQPAYNAPLWVLPLS